MKALLVALQFKRLPAGLTLDWNKLSRLGNHSQIASEMRSFGWQSLVGMIADQSRPQGGGGECLLTF